jgi:hypothetical protein
MKKTNFTQQGGFPLEQVTLDKMQSAYMEILAAIIGHLDIPTTGNYIISGCKVVTSGITSGMMYIDGELCPFAGIQNGNASTKIAKIETIEDAPFESGDNLPTYYTYVALENSGGVELSNFETIPNVPQLINQIPQWSQIQGIPSDIVYDANYQTLLNEFTELKLIMAPFKTGNAPIFWGKPANEIPPGWAEDLDWRGRIPVGMNINISGGQFVDPEFAPLTNANEPGRLNGAKKKTLTAAEIPALTVGIPYTVDYPGGSDTFVLGPGQYGTKPVNLGGSSQEFSILPPTRTVLFIKWVGI